MKGLTTISDCNQCLQELKSRPCHRSIEGEYCDLNLAAYAVLGDSLHLDLAPYYYEYANFIITLLEQDPSIVAPYTLADTPEHHDSIYQQSDYDIAQQNIAASLCIYEKQFSRLGGNQLGMEETGLLNSLTKVCCRFGDLYAWSGHHVESLMLYSKSKFYLQKQRRKHPNLEAEIECLIGHAMLRTQTRGCEEVARHHLVRAVNLLCDSLESRLDNIRLQRVTENNIQVDRLRLLPNLLDSKEVKELKVLIMQLLDKLEDLAYDIQQAPDTLKFLMESKGKINRLGLGFIGAADLGNQAKYLGTFGSALPKVKLKGGPNNKNRALSVSKQNCQANQRQTS